ncbi:hypothetical protein T01_12272 [Trichinella spiralis]|uniref:Uncharacterized protein n=1 Tax=Trichinella spiralis TaxID=6334 RepID=A0A0V1BAD2_TRISP|nr:hypothetical protein T01_12272 [Trichinella spiralis]
MWRIAHTAPLSQLQDAKLKLSAEMERSINIPPASAFGRYVERGDVYTSGKQDMMPRNSKYRMSPSHMSHI